MKTPLMVSLGLRGISIDLISNVIIGNIIPGIDNWAHGFGLIGATYINILTK